MGSTSPSSRYAVVTGGASGIGLSLVKHLLSKPGLKVIVADINTETWKAAESSIDSDRTLFIQTDVASWESQAAMFKKAFEWSQGRIDFFAANAGIADKDSFYAPFDLEAEPRKPNLITVEIDETGVYYGLQLYLYYTRKDESSTRG